MQYKLDNSKAQKLQISNDAFHYLMYGEEPLDDSNLDEANEIIALFPFGYSISDWEYVENEFDLIEATFIPYVKDSIKYDGRMNFIAKNWVFKYKMLDAKTAHICIENEVTGEVNAEFDCCVTQFNNKPWVIFKDGRDACMLLDFSSCCQIPLWKCNKI